MSTRTTYSNFLRGPSTILPQVEQADVILERRDGEDLILTTASRSQAATEGLVIGVSALRHIASTHREVLCDSLIEALPWVTWLPEVDRDACINELVADLAASVAVGDFSRFHSDLVAWRNTARVWSNPELAEQLSSESSDTFGEVDRPTLVK